MRGVVLGEGASGSLICFSSLRMRRAYLCNGSLEFVCGGPGVHIYQYFYASVYFNLNLKFPSHPSGWDTGIKLFIKSLYRFEPPGGPASNVRREVLGSSRTSSWTRILSRVIRQLRGPLWCTTVTEPILACPAILSYEYRPVLV